MKRIFIAGAAFALFACNTAVSHEHPETDPGVKQEAAATDGHEGKNTPVQLDNGKKWQANKETTQGIQNMIKITGSAIAAKTNPGQVREPLQKEFKTIFEKCTMKGEAHDQLHNYLLPVKEHIEKLKTADVSSGALASLQQYLNTYENYFE